MKSNQVQTRLTRKHIEIVTKLAHDSHMTLAAMLRRLILERLEQIAQSSQDFVAVNISEPTADGGRPDED